MADKPQVEGLEKVLKILSPEQIDAAVRIGTGEIMLACREVARNESSGPARWQHGQNFPRAGGPGIVTGEHRAGIVTEGPQQRGTASYEGSVVAQAPHSAGLERGTSRHPPYKFFAPAVEQVRPKAREMLIRHIVNALKGNG